VRCSSAVLDGEICCLQPDGRTDFYNLLFRREQPYFYAFDLLMLNGEGLRGLTLTERKRRLRAIMPKVECRVLFLDSIAERGRISFHGLRQASATLLLKAGVAPYVDQQRLGHKRIEMTLSIYAHAVPSMQQDAARRLARLLHG
jgi:ATP-dependent DNA ligase